MNPIVRLADLTGLSSCPEGIDVYRAFGGTDEELEVTPEILHAFRTKHFQFYLWCVRHRLLPTPSRDVKKTETETHDHYEVDGGFVLHHPPGTPEAQVRATIDALIFTPEV